MPKHNKKRSKQDFDSGFDSGPDDKISIGKEAEGIKSGPPVENDEPTQ